MLLGGACTGGGLRGCCTCCLENRVTDICWFPVFLFLLSQQQFDSGAGLSTSGEQVRQPYPLCIEQTKSLMGFFQGQTCDFARNPSEHFLASHVQGSEPPMTARGWGQTPCWTEGVERLPKGAGLIQEGQHGIWTGPLKQRREGKVGAGDKRRCPKPQQPNLRTKGFSTAQANFGLTQTFWNVLSRDGPYPFLAYTLKAPGNKNLFFIFIWKMPAPEILLSCKVKKASAPRGRWGN